MNVEQVKKKYQILCRAIDRCDQGIIKIERKINTSIVKGAPVPNLGTDLTEQKEGLENLRLQLSQTMRILGVKL